jgi:hypothetical protein
LAAQSGHFATKRITIRDDPAHRLLPELNEEMLSVVAKDPWVERRFQQCVPF